MYYQKMAFLPVFVTAKVRKVYEICNSIIKKRHFCQFLSLQWYEKLMEYAILLSKNDKIASF